MRNKICWYKMDRDGIEINPMVRACVSTHIALPASRSVVRSLLLTSLRKRPKQAQKWTRTSTAAHRAEKRKAGGKKSPYPGETRLHERVSQDPGGGVTAAGASLAGGEPVTAKRRRETCDGTGVTPGGAAVVGESEKLSPDCPCARDFGPSNSAEGQDGPYDASRSGIVLWAYHLGPRLSEPKNSAPVAWLRFTSLHCRERKRYKKLKEKNISGVHDTLLPQ
jgi:hypothetical protein